MASGDKSAKTQLLAIYRLEIYKNKKNWKLYEYVRKEPPPSPTTENKLNKTYNVGEEFQKPEYDVEQVSPHNKAFLGEEPEDGPDPQPPDEPASLSAPEHNLYRPHSWPEQPWSGDKTDALWLDALQDWSGAGAEPGSMPEELAYDQCDGHQQNLCQVIGKQMNSLSMLTAVYGHTQGQPIQPGAAPPEQKGANILFSLLIIQFETFTLYLFPAIRKRERQRPALSKFRF